MSKIINNFTSKEQVQQVLDKLNEYEWIKITNHNPYDSYPNDKGLYIRVVWDIYCYWQYKSNYENEDWNIIISADNYLHPVKEWDIVEVHDDSEYDEVRFKVIEELDDWYYKLEDTLYCITRHQDYLRVIKEQRLNTVNKNLRVWDLVTLINDYTIYKIVHKFWKWSERDWYKIVNIDPSYTKIHTVWWWDIKLATNIERVWDLEELEINNKTYKNNILNTNNKTMNTIQREAKAIATEDYFANNKIIKKVRQADAEMQDLLDILENALKEINKKRSRLNWIATNFNRNYYEKNMDTIKDMLNNHKEVLEFMDNFIAQSVSDFTEETTKEKFNVEDIFNS